MLLPANFKQTIADHFYDKTLNLLAKTSTSVDGWVDETATTVIGEFNGNVRFSKLGEVQSELGLTSQIHIAVTCDNSVAIEKGDLFSYDDVTYRATAVIPTESHKKIAGERWLSK